MRNFDLLGQSTLRLLSLKSLPPRKIGFRYFSQSQPHLRLIFACIHILQQQNDESTVEVAVLI